LVPVLEANKSKRKQNYFFTKEKQMVSANDIHEARVFLEEQGYRLTKVTEQSYKSYVYSNGGAVRGYPMSFGAGAHYEPAKIIFCWEYKDRYPREWYEERAAIIREQYPQYNPQVLGGPQGRTTFRLLLEVDQSDYLNSVLEIVKNTKNIMGY
jgi:hypothetical protein